MALLDYIEQARQVTQRKKVSIWIDGACHPNPGFGSWGAVLRYGDREKHLSGIVPEDPTTSSRAELYAAIKALGALREPCVVAVSSDSSYLVETMLGNYRRGANEDLWGLLDAVVAPHQVSWTWVRGHAGDRDNEVAHRLAERVLRVKSAPEAERQGRWCEQLDVGRRATS